MGAFLLTDNHVFAYGLQKIILIIDYFTKQLVAILSRVYKRADDLSNWLLTEKT